VKLGKFLRSGHTKSCGCLSGETTAIRNTTHGLSKNPLYGLWIKVKDRCSNQNCEDYKYYGARGIKVCDRWLNSFPNFLADMGPRPSRSHSIDRINTNGNYEPGNCRWATPLQQNSNRRNSRLFEHGGKSLTLQQWSIEVGVRLGTIASRIDNGWSIEEALTIPVGTPRYPRP